MLGLLMTIIVFSRLLPRPREGKYKFPGNTQIALWSYHFLIQRIAMLPSFRYFFMSFHTLKFLYLRALGTKIHYLVWSSSNIELSECYLITIKKDVTLGSRSEISCHFVRDGQMVLAPTVIEERAQLLLDAIIGPGCIIGKNTVVGISSKLTYKVIVGENSVIGACCFFQTHIKIGNHVKIGDFVSIESAVVIDDHVTVPSGTWIRKGMKINKDTKFLDMRWQEIRRENPRGPIRQESGLRALAYSEHVVHAEQKLDALRVEA